LKARRFKGKERCIQAIERKRMGREGKGRE